MQNQKPVNLKMASFPKMFGELMHSNQFLKTFTLSALIVSLMSLAAVMVLTMKDPFVITLGPDGKSLEQLGLPKIEDQLKEGFKRYLEKRYQWDPENVKKKLKEAEEFIHPSKLRPYQLATTSVQRFSMEKSVSQRVYPEGIKINLKDKTALITGDRVTSIQGLKAAGDLRLVLAFEYGPRTTENPWGLYIMKETEE